MSENLLEMIEEEINNYQSIDELRLAFIKHGYLEKDIDEAVLKITRSARKLTHIEMKADRLFTWKEVLDRVGFGFVTHQFINILFYLTGAGYLLLGLMNGLKAMLSIIFSSFLREYSQVHDLSKEFMSKTGILFGFSFLIMAWARRIENVWLFAFALVLGALSVVTYGDFYNKVIKETIKSQHKSYFLSRVSYYGILITAVCLLMSGWLMERFPADGPLQWILGAKYPVYGYLLSFEISAFTFILAGYVLNFLPYKRQNKKYPLIRFTREYIDHITSKSKVFLRNKHVLMLLGITTLLGAVQILGNSYYGIFIYKTFREQWLGGFMNVAAIYAIALLVSFIGPFLTKRIERAIGLAPMIVFGVLLMALMPFTLAFNPDLFAVTIANALSIIGAVIVGVAQGLLARRLLSDKDRSTYFATSGIMSTIPFLLLVPAGAYLASLQPDLSHFFGILAGLLVVVIMPLSFALVLSTNHHKI
ncbi:MAG: MFS transporter [Nanoarchaeota archaeon]